MTALNMHAGAAFQLLVESVEDYAIFLLDPEGRVLTWNLGGHRIKGYSASQVIGQHFSIFYTPEERERGRPVQMLSRAAAEGRVEDEGWRVRRNGTWFWANVVVTALLDGNGTLIGFAKVTRDLTERRAAEDQQRQLLAEQRARAAAEEALVARDRFLAIAAHELRTPVASLQLAIEGLERARSEDRLDDARIERSLSRMSASVSRLGELVSELLDVRSLDGPFRPGPVDLLELTHDVLTRFGETGHQARLRLEAPPSVSMVGDASQLDQLLTNLVDNALKYSSPKAPVDVRISERDDGVCISVADEGIGLDIAARDRLFEAFGRGENVGHTGGMGLGLYICHSIVERHGGRIEVQARADGPGTVADIWLPSRPAGR